MQVLDEYLQYWKTKEKLFQCVKQFNKERILQQQDDAKLALLEEKIKVTEQQNKTNLEAFQCELKRNQQLLQDKLDQVRDDEIRNINELLVAQNEHIKMLQHVQNLEHRIADQQEHIAKIEEKKRKEAEIIKNAINFAVTVVCEFVPPCKVIKSAGDLAISIIS